MSRSRRKTPICGVTTAVSEKKDKRINNRRIRRLNKVILEKTFDEDELVSGRTLTNPWMMGKDGRQRFAKDDECYDKEMRK